MVVYEQHGTGSSIPLEHTFTEPWSRTREHEAIESHPLTDRRLSSVARCTGLTRLFTIEGTDLVVYMQRVG
jgi:hypothetical protein